MDGKIYAMVEIDLEWNDESNEWEVDPRSLVGDLAWGGRDGEGRPTRAGGPEQRTGALDRATGHRITAEDLTHMLGFAMVRATAPANADVEWRPASPSLIGMLKDVMAVKLPRDVTLTARDELIRALLPLISSVDENAHRRGMSDQRKAAVAQ